MSQRLGAIPWFIGTAGVALVWAAVANLSPLQLLRGILTGEGEAGPIDTGVRQNFAPIGGTTAPAASADVAGFASGLSSGPVALVEIGQGSDDVKKLDAPAAAAFKTWEQAAGVKLWVTTAYRSTAQQAASYNRAVANGEPDRFAPPGKSWHEKGRAVDLDLPRIGATGPGRGQRAGDALYERIRNAGVAAGWCFPRAGTAGDGAEPWHASFGGCG